jgi:mRNA interferase RelE/StbE
MYEIVFTESVKKDFEKLDRVVQKKIARKLLILQSNPFYQTKKLTGSVVGDYRFRIGDYRVIFDIDEKRIVIHKIGHWREVYRF